MTSQIDRDVYEAAHNTAVFTDRSDLGMLKITGETRLNLLDRMSTQQVTQLQRGEGTATVLTTEIGRIIDRIILYTSSDTAYALTGENHAQQLAQYLMKFVFFDDDFHMEDISADTAVFGVYGPEAPTMLENAGFPDTDLPLHHWRQVEVTGITAYLHRTDPIGGHGYFIMSQMADRDILHTYLQESGFPFADEDAFEVLRVEAGLPRLRHELTMDYIPLEANLWEDVAFDKGCYIGQEIIARMESRGRLAKQLVKLTPAAPVAEGAEIRADGKKAGTITSAVVGPDGPLALGYVKTGVLQEEDAELTVGETAVSLASP